MVVVRWSGWPCRIAFVAELVLTACGGGVRGGDVLSSSTVTAVAARELRPTHNAEATTTAPGPRSGVMVHVDAAGALRVGERTVTAQELVAMVGDAPSVLLISAEPEVLWGVVLRSIEAPARAAASRHGRVLLASERGEPLASLVGIHPGPEGVTFRVEAYVTPEGPTWVGPSRTQAGDLSEYIRAALARPGPPAQPGAPEVVPVGLHASEEAPTRRVLHAAELARAAGVRAEGILVGLLSGPPPPVRGLLSPAAIRQVVSQNISQVTACHEAGLGQNPNAQGRISIRFVVQGDGSVREAAVYQSTYPVASVGPCIAQAVRGWRFPAPEGGGIVTVNYPFNLQIAEEEASP